MGRHLCSGGSVGNAEGGLVQGTGRRAVRRAARSRADRARGFAATSASPASTPLRARSVKVGAAISDSGLWREPPDRAAERSARKRLTMRSSSEWNATTTSRPPSPRMRSDAASASASSSSSRLTKMRSAWNVRVAGWIGLPRLPPTARETISARSWVVLSGPLRARLDDRGRDRPRPLLLAEHGDDPRKVALVEGVDDVAGGRPVRAHAHVERPGLHEREPAPGGFELVRRHADVEHDAVDALVAVRARDFVQRREAALDQRQLAFGTGAAMPRRARSPRGRGRWR